MCRRGHPSKIQTKFYIHMRIILRRERNQNETNKLIRPTFPERCYRLFELIAVLIEAQLTDALEQAILAT